MITAWWPSEVVHPDDLQTYTEDGWVEESYLEYGTGHSHWTDTEAQEEVERNPIGFVWPST